MIDVSSFLSKRDWYAIFVADIFLLLVTGLALVSRVVLWVFFVGFALALVLSVYMTFFKKYSLDDGEFDSALNSIKNDMFGGNKNG
jgi:hypothetical protein